MFDFLLPFQTKGNVGNPTHQAQDERIINKRCAFTLAEVLITLGIIGVVAAITIPTLINNYQKHATATQLKKAYSELTQAFFNLAKDEGCPNDLECTGLFVSSGQVPSTNAMNKLVNHIKVIKQCAHNDNKCILTYPACLNSSCTGSGAGAPAIAAGGYAFAIDDADNNNCKYHNDSINDGCSFVIIDINGLNKGPNKMGKDFFFYILRKNGTLYPYSKNYWNYNGTNACRMDIESVGYNCAGRIMEESWQVTY